MKRKITITEKPLYVAEATLSLDHAGCIMRELAKRLKQNLFIDIPVDPIENHDIVHAYFSIPQSLTEREIKELFKNFNGNLERAEVYAPPNLPTVFEIYYRDPPLLEVLELEGVSVHRYVATQEDERIDVRVRTKKLVDVASILEKIENVHLESYRRIPTLEPVPAEAILSQKEINILRNLLEWGYFSLPKKGITLQEAANRLGISDSKLSLELRNIADKVFREYLRRALRFEYP